MGKTLVQLQTPRRISRREVLTGDVDSDTFARAIFQASDRQPRKPIDRYKLTTLIAFGEGYAPKITSRCTANSSVVIYYKI